MAKLLRSSVQKRNIVFGCGDFNMLPSSLAHRIISTHGLVADSWLSAYPKTLDTNPPGASARFNIENLGVTCDSVINTWRAAGHETPSLETVDPFGKRLDYVFHSPEQSSVRSISVGMTKPMLIPGSKGVTCSVSDHFSIELQLALAPCPEQQRAFALAKAQGPVPINTQINVSRPVNGPINKLDLQTPSTKIEEYLDDSIVEAILAVFQEYYRREVKEKKWRIRHFFFSVAALVPLSIGIWWSPHNAISFAIMLASLVIVVTGILDGLIGFIFTGSGEFAIVPDLCLTQFQS
jgi:sphingomyelin phosphodiesterase 2